MPPRATEIDHRVLKLMVGLIGLFLASATSLFSEGTIMSISASHCYGGWARDFFVGSLFAIAAFMAAYNGFTRAEMWIAKITAVAAIGVAWFPSKCLGVPEILPGAHLVSAVIMFSMLALLCRVFYVRARNRKHAAANRRAWVYATCGNAILVAMGFVVFDYLLGNPVKSAIPRIDFYCEEIALVAFGAAWLTASHTLPGLTAREEKWMGRPSVVP